MWPAWKSLTAEMLALAMGVAGCAWGADSRTSAVPFGRTPSGDEVLQISLRNRAGVVVSFLTWGVTLLEVRVPDRHGTLDNINLRLDSFEGYLAGHPMLGSTVGRFANRIDTGGFTIGGRRYSLGSVDPKSGVHIHGGKTGFHAQNWRLQELREDAVSAVAVLTWLSPDGHEGYPGELQVTARVTLHEENWFTLEYEARTGQPTHVNLTNHSYWNLGGARSGSVLRHRLQLAASRVLEFDGRKIPTGRLLPVAGTSLDFLQPRPLGERIAEVAPGYDHCFVLDDGRDQAPGFAARLEDPVSGRVLELRTSAPGLQCYTANHLKANLSFQGHPYGPHQGVCLECQHFPDSPNRPEFPSTLLLPDQVYRSRIEHRFSVLD